MVEVAYKSDGVIPRLHRGDRESLRTQWQSVDKRVAFLTNIILLIDGNIGTPNKRSDARIFLAMLNTFGMWDQYTHSEIETALQDANPSAETVQYLRSYVPSFEDAARSWHQASISQIPMDASSSVSSILRAPSKKEALIEKYVADLKEKVGEARPDMALLEAIVKACGPTIYKRDASMVAASNKDELETIRRGFITKKLGVTDEDKANAAMKAAAEAYGKSLTGKHRAVFYYLVAKKLKKGSVLKGESAKN